MERMRSWMRRWQVDPETWKDPAVRAALYMVERDDQALRRKEATIVAEFKADRAARKRGR